MFLRVVEGDANWERNQIVGIKKTGNLDIPFIVVGGKTYNPGIWSFGMSPNSSAKEIIEQIEKIHEFTKFELVDGGITKKVTTLNNIDFSSPQTYLYNEVMKTLASKGITEVLKSDNEMIKANVQFLDESGQLTLDEIEGCIWECFNDTEVANLL